MNAVKLFKFNYSTLIIGLAPSDRAVLHHRIAGRFDTMLQDGLIEELRELRERYLLTSEMPSMRAVGYRQSWEFLDGKINFKSLRETGIIATRQLAKRQLTWLRGMSDVENFDCLRQDLTEAVVERVGNFLKPSA